VNYANIIQVTFTTCTTILPSPLTQHSLYLYFDNEKLCMDFLCTFTYRRCPLSYLALTIAAPRKIYQLSCKLRELLIPVEIAMVMLAS